MPMRCCVGIQNYTQMVNKAQPPLASSSTSFNPSVPSSLFTYQRGDPRLNKTSLLGARWGDGIPESVKIKVAQAVKEENSDLFVNIGIEHLHTLSKLHPKHPFYIDPCLLYFTPESPAFPVLKEMLTLCFNRCLIAAGLRPGNNRSGFAPGGMRGTGKSWLFQLACTLASQLLPNFIGIYIDCTMSPAALTKLTLLSLMQAALLELGWIDLAKRNVMSTMLAGARVAGVTFRLFLDEARYLYSPHLSAWYECHELLTNHYVCVFMADSTTLLPALVRGDKVRIQDMGIEPLISLNSSKMIPLHLPPFTSVDQYSQFLALPHQPPAHPSFLSTYLSADKSMKRKLIAKLHTHTGGTLRNIHEAVVRSTASLGDGHAQIPAYNTCEFYLLRKLYDLQDSGQQEESINIFDMINVSETTMLTWIKEFFSSVEGSKAEHPYRLLASMVDDNHLSKAGTTAGSSIYSFASAHQFFALKAISPRVFISHAEKDKEVILKTPSQLLM